MNSAPEFVKTDGNWRDSLRRNNQKTIGILIVFFLMYISLGLLVDTYVLSTRYPNVPLSDILRNIVHLQVFPLATTLMLGVALASLLITLSFHDQLMLLGTEYFEITPTTARNTAEQQLYNVIEEMKIASSLSFMPRVYVIDADYMNAFASGYSEKSAMVAITRGLMEKLNRDEMQAVMAHELSHVRHLDIKITLMASLLANLMLIVVDFIFYSALFSSNDRNRSRNNLVMVILVVRYLLPVINILLLLYLSRTREYLADAGCVELMRDNHPLASALMKIQNDHDENHDQYQAAYSATPHENVRREAYIFDPTQAGISSVGSIADWFSTHPSVPDRLRAIGVEVRDNTP